MKRYEKFVLEAEKGITFEVSEGTSGELIIRALNIATANVYSENYAIRRYRRDTSMFAETGRTAL